MCHRLWRKSVIPDKWGGGVVRLLESVGPLVAVKPADHLRFGGRRGRGRIAFFPVGWGGPDSGGVLWPAVRRCSPRPGYHGCAGPGAMMTVRARAAGVLIAVVLAAAAAGCTGDVQQVPASSAPAPATPGTSKGSVSSAGGTGSGSVEDRAARSDQLLASMVAADQPGCSAAVAIDGQVVRAGARGLANLEQKDTADHGHPVRHRLGVQAVHRHRDPVAVLRRRPHPCRTRCPSTCQGCPRGRIRSPWTS